MYTLYFTPQILESFFSTNVPRKRFPHSAMAGKPPNRTLTHPAICRRKMPEQNGYSISRIRSPVQICPSYMKKRYMLKRNVIKYPITRPVMCPSLPGPYFFEIEGAAVPSRICLIRSSACICPTLAFVLNWMRCTATAGNTSLTSSGTTYSLPFK